MSTPSFRLAGAGPGVAQDSTGHTIASRPISVFARDTSTPVQVYQDEALTLTLSQPLLTDGNGQVPGFVAAGQSIDFYDTVSGQRMQVEAISGAAIATITSPPVTAGLIPVGNAAGVSIFETADSPYVVCNGRTHTAIAAAIAALPTITHPTLGSIQWGTVFLPPGAYTFSGTVALPSYCHIEGLKRAICVRGAGFNGLLFQAASAITQSALNGLVWDNNGTANLMWEIANGSSSFVHDWARYQNTSGNVSQIDGGASLNYDITVSDIRLYAVGSPSNQNGMKFYDCANLSIKGVKSLIQSGTSGLSALNCEALGSAPACRNWNIEDVELDTPGATALFVRNNFGGVIESVSVKGIRGQGIGSATIPKGLVDMGEQAAGTPGQSTTCGITIEDVEGRDWWGALVSIGTADSGGGNVFDFNVSNVRGDGATVAGSVDTTRTNTVLAINGAQHGNVDGVVARNTGNGGIRFVSTTFQPAAYIRVANADVESCVQNTTSGWHETGIFMDSATHDITFVNPRSVNNYSAANPGGSQVGAGIGSAAASSSTQCNNITIINPVCTDTRAGGSQFQDYGIRIGESDPDAWQPNNWTIIYGDLRGNGVGTTKQYGTTNHGHLIVNNRGDTLLPFPSAAIVTATNASWPIPAGANYLEVTCVGGHGAGGGGGSAAATQLQVGGAGGVAATYTTQIVAVGSNSTLNITIGAGATHGSGGAAGGNPGTAGSGATDTTVTGTGISVKAKGGPSGNGSAASSTTAVAAVAAYGSATRSLGDSQGGPGLGGASGAAGGDPLGLSPGGGGGGGPATTTLGGGGGNVGALIGAGTAGASGASGTAAGVAGVSGGAWGTATYGPGGGGGGGAAGTGAGGNGGDGSPGVVIIKVVG